MKSQAIPIQQQQPVLNEANYDGPSNSKSDNGNDRKFDVFKDTSIRYLGYANEVGEAFRAQVPVSVVNLTYAIATGYVIADAIHKGQQASEEEPTDNGLKNQKVGIAIGDTLIWQGLASVVIPGFTINRICKMSNFLLSKRSRLPAVTRKWITTGIGLGCIPLIISPIDRTVDALLNNTLRKWIHIETDLSKVVHHKRND